jgi:hypothetical protein
MWVTVYILLICNQGPGMQIFRTQDAVKISLHHLNKAYYKAECKTNGPIMQN